MKCNLKVIHSYCNAKKGPPTATDGEGPLILFILTGNPEIFWRRKKEGNYNKFLSEYRRVGVAKDYFTDQAMLINNDGSLKNSFNKIREKLYYLLNRC